MKVSEAKKKICPFMSYQERSLHELYNTTCVCGDCMAWEYTKQVSDRETIQSTVKKGDITYSVNNPKPLIEDDKEGYCKRLTND